MNFTFSKVSEVLPKKTNRSERLHKKLHIGKYKEIMFSFTIKIPVFELEEEKQNVCLDIMCEHDTACFIFTENSRTNFSMIAGTIRTSDNIESEIEDYINNLVSKLAEVENEFSKVDAVHVEYGDAYYGEWE